MAWLISKKHRGECGFSLVEALLASLLFGLIATAAAGALAYGRTATVSAGDNQRAAALADEGLQAVRNIRDAAFSNLADGTYGLAQAGGVWTLSGTSDQTGIYSRSITIASSGTDRKQLISTVTWDKGNVTVQGLLTNWRAPLPPTRSWGNAIFTGSVNLGGTQDGLKVATTGDYAYIIRASGTPNFAIVNIHTPSAPVLTGSLALAGAPTNITVNGNYAYVTNSQNTGEVQTVSVSNPAAPSLSATTNLAGNADATGIYASGTYAYVTRLGNGNNAEFNVLSLANPVSPTIAGTYSNNINMREVYKAGNYAYIVTDADTQELLVLSVANPAAPTLVGSLDLPGTANATAITGLGTYLYIGQGTALRVVSIAAPATPILTGTYTASGTINDLDADSTDPAYIFLATSNPAAEFQVADVSTPAVPTVARNVDQTGANTLQGIAFNASLDAAIGASTADTQEGVVFAPN